MDVYVHTYVTQKVENHFTRLIKRILDFLPLRPYI